MRPGNRRKNATAEPMIISVSPPEKNWLLSRVSNSSRIIWVERDRPSAFKRGVFTIDNSSQLPVDQETRDDGDGFRRYAAPTVALLA
jgi:hypothetical protein